MHLSLSVHVCVYIYAYISTPQFMLPPDPPPSSPLPLALSPLQGPSADNPGPDGVCTFPLSREVDYIQSPKKYGQYAISYGRCVRNTVGRYSTRHEKYTQYIDNYWTRFGHQSGLDESSGQ